MVKGFKLSLILFTTFLITNCSSKGFKILEDEKSSVSNDLSFYDKNYRLSKEVGLPETIDTNSIYIEEYYLFGPNKVKYIRDEDDGIFIYRFYPNGNVNDFSIPSIKKLNDLENFNPDKTGRRGICFYENGNWYIDILGKSSELKTMGTYRYKLVEVSKDTIKLQWVRKNENTIYVYSRKKIENDSILEFKANW